MRFVIKKVTQMGHTWYGDFALFASSAAGDQLVCPVQLNYSVGALSIKFPQAVTLNLGDQFAIELS